jgi:hypothetical protein
MKWKAWGEGGFRMSDYFEVQKGKVHGYYAFCVALLNDKCNSYEKAADHLDRGGQIDKKAIQKIIALHEQGYTFYRIETMLSLKKNTAKYYVEKVAAAKVG